MVTAVAESFRSLINQNLFKSKNVNCLKLTELTVRTLKKVNCSKSSRSEVFYKKGVLRNLAKFTGNTPLPESLF